MAISTSAKKLDLTPERREIIAGAYTEWLTAGLSTDPADFDTAETSVTALYAAINKPRPYFVRVSSPLAAELYINLLCTTWPEIMKRGQLRDQLGGRLRDQLGGQLWGQLWDQLGGQLRGQLRDQLGGQLWGQLRDQLGGQKLSFMGTWFYGAWDFYWMWLEGGRRVGAVYSDRENAMLDAHVAISRSIGWWYPFNDFVILTDRPEQIRRNGDGQLHNEHGMALRYRDGTGVHAWNGQRVPAEWIENPGSIGPAEALTWPNADQRAAAMQIAGMANVLREAGARTVDAHTNPLIGELVEVSHPAIGKRERFVIAHERTDRSGRIFGIPVPPDTKTALEGQARIQGIPAPVLETMTART